MKTQNTPYCPKCHSMEIVTFKKWGLVLTLAIMSKQPWANVS
ncbi:MAG: hypothetical protein OEM02_07600 [Desulfobulbaceae bacterium]|nr:hypothetical protein [Desulfobulbaceae bacterium]